MEMPTGTDRTRRLLRLSTASCVFAAMLSCSGHDSVEPTPPADSTAPTTPTNFTVTTASASQVNLSWSAATDNVGVTQYRVERCQGSGCTSFTQVGASTTNSFSNTGLTAGTFYTYRVRSADAAGNTSAYSSTASAMTGGGTTADADWQARSTAPGVILAEGFDNFNAATFPTLCPGGSFPSASTGQCYNQAANGSTRAFLDTNVYASGDVSTGKRAALRFDIHGIAGADVTGNYFTRWPQVFGENSHFYVQYRVRYSPGMVDGGPGNWTVPNWGGQGWKTSLFTSPRGPLCGPIELAHGAGYGPLWLYTRCSGTIYDNFQPPADGLYGYTPNWRAQQGNYSGCAYAGTPNRQTDCAWPHGSEWMTMYFDVQIGTWGANNSHVKAYVAYNDGQGYRQWIDAPNYRLDGYAGDGYGLLTLGHYNTARTGSAPANPIHSWFDEVIVSTQPIAAPGGVPSR